MDFKDANAIIEFAIEKEIEAALFYETVAKEESFSGIREMLLEFAGEERKHQRMLENMDKGAIESYKLTWIKDLKVSNFLVDLEHTPGMGYRDLLLLAMKREEKALALYNELQTHTDQENLIKLFRILSQEEAKHKLALEKMYDDYMAEMGD